MKRMNQVAKGESKEKRKKKKKKSPDKNIAQPARVSLICSFIFHFTCTSAWVRAAAAAGKRWCRRGSSLNLRREAPTNEKRGNIKWILFCIWATFNQMSFHQIDNYNYYFPIRLPFQEGREVKGRGRSEWERTEEWPSFTHTHTQSRLTHIRMWCKSFLSTVAERRLTYGLNVSTWLRWEITSRHVTVTL